MICRALVAPMTETAFAGLGRHRPRQGRSHDRGGGPAIHARGRGRAGRRQRTGHLKYSGVFGASPNGPVSGRLRGCSRPTRKDVAQLGTGSNPHRAGRCGAVAVARCRSCGGAGSNPASSCSDTAGVASTLVARQPTSSLPGPPASVCPENQVDIRSMD